MARPRATKKRRRTVFGAGRLMCTFLKRDGSRFGIRGFHPEGFAAIRVDASCKAAALAASKVSAVPFAIKSEVRACRTSYRTSHVGTPFSVRLWSERG